jgi:DNA-binding winged helix-turn-helix (wHTH) protein
MHHATERTNPRQIARRHDPSRWASIKTNTRLQPRGAGRSTSASADSVIEFGSFRLLLRRRELLADGMPVELGTRAFDVLLVLLEADGSLVTKEELLNRVWPDIVVSEENLKVQVAALRKALGEDRDIIRTEFGRGYRFTGVLRSKSVAEARERSMPAEPRSGRAVFPRYCRESLGYSFSRATDEAR